jgi:hypothetical protein
MTVYRAYRGWWRGVERGQPLAAALVSGTVGALGVLTGLGLVSAWSSTNVSAWLVGGFVGGALGQRWRSHRLRRLRGGG